MCLFSKSVKKGNERIMNMDRDIIKVFQSEEMVNASDFLYNSAKQIMEKMVGYKELMMMYACAIKEVRTKFDVLNTEFNARYRRNPISTITTRLKKSSAIADKMIKRNIPFTLKNIDENVHDVAGVRVVCPYIDDIYLIADAFLKQDDITLISKKDYIENPKPNGYRSLHLIVIVPVYFAKQKKDMKVEVQIRTIAMDFWASLEHQMKYKQEIPDQEAISEELKECAQTICETDEKMLGIRKKIEAAADFPSDDELLFEKFSKLDISFQ